MVFFFEAANITNQILNFGLPAPIDVQVLGRNAAVQLRNRAPDRRQGRADPGRGRRPYSSGGGYPGDRYQRGPQQGRTGGPDAARRGHQPADFAEFQRTDRAHAVSGLAHRRQLWRRRADPAVPHGFAGSGAAHAGQFAIQRREHHDGDVDRRLGQPHQRRCRRRTEPVLRRLRQPRRGLGRSAVALEYGDRRPQRRARNRQPLQRAAGDGRVRQCGPPRSRQRGRGSREDRRGDDAQAAARHHDRRARADHSPCRIPSTASAWA